MKLYILPFTLLLILFQFNTGYSQTITYNDFSQLEERFISVKLVTYGDNRFETQVPYYILVDLTTGVQYLGTNNGLTVILNEEGKPDKLTPDEIIPSLVNHINMKLEKYNDQIDDFFIGKEKEESIQVKIDSLKSLLSKMDS